MSAPESSPRAALERGSRGASVEWQTPPDLVRALGPFDLDPCEAADQRIPTARRSFTAEDDGLSKEWSGLVFMNPPYGHGLIGKWMAKLADHGNGIALIPARTDTRAFHRFVWGRASAVLFLDRRLRFYNAESRSDLPAMFPSALVAFGTEATARLAMNAGEWGFFVYLRAPHPPKGGE